MDNQILIELRAKLVVDTNQLHLSAQEQPELMQLAGELAAEAKYAARKARLAAEIASATAAKDIRKNPATFGISKVTESSISEAVVLHPQVVKANTEAIEADKESDMAATIAVAFEHRKAVLRIEADLYANEYWGRANAVFPANY